MDIREERLHHNKLKLDLEQYQNKMRKSFQQSGIIPTAIDSFGKEGDVQSRKQCIKDRNCLATPASGIWATSSNSLLKKQKSIKNMRYKRIKYNIRSSSNFSNDKNITLNLSVREKDHMYNRKNLWS